MNAHINDLYVGDNGRIFCYAHGGATFKASGHDLSGQKVMRLRVTDLAELRAIIGRNPCCETCSAIATRAALAKAEDRP